jgi:hypothetical protein
MGDVVDSRHEFIQTNILKVAISTRGVVLNSLTYSEPSIDFATNCS